jgi:hypothetical protein
MVKDTYELTVKDLENFNKKLVLHSMYGKFGGLNSEKPAVKNFNQKNHLALHKKSKGN